MEAARVEMAGDAIRNRVSQEGSSQRASLLVEIGVPASRCRLRDRPEDPACVGKLDRQKMAASDGAVGPHLPFHRNAQDVSTSQVAGEVHLPGEYVRQVIDHLLEFLLPDPFHLSAKARRPEARLDDPGDAHGIQDEGNRLDAGRPDGVIVNEMQKGIGRQREEDTVRNAGRSKGEAQRRSRTKRARAPVCL